MAEYRAQPDLLKKLNMATALNMIRINTSISKPNIAEMTRLSLTTVNKLLNELSYHKLISVIGEGKSSGGRKASLYKINASYGNVCGVLLQANKIEIMVSDFSGKSIVEKRYKINCREKTLQELLEIIKTYVSDIKQQKDIIGICVALPGVVGEEGIIENAPTMPCLEGSNLEKDLKRLLNIPAFCENDVNIGCIGLLGDEYKNSESSLAYMLLSAGTGMGIVLCGELYKGSKLFAGEIGNIITDYHSMQSENSILFEKEIEQFVQEKKIDSKKKQEFILKFTAVILNIMYILDLDMIILDGTVVDDQFIKEMKMLMNSKGCGLIADRVCRAEKNNTILQGCISHCIRSVMPLLIEKITENSRSNELSFYTSAK